MLSGCLTGLTLPAVRLLFGRDTWLHSNQLTYSDQPSTWMPMQLPELKSENERSGICETFSRLSTGQYTLIDVQCRKCYMPLGWRYVSAERSDQKYKEGCTLLQQGLLRRINCIKYSNCTAITPFRRVSEIPPPPQRR